MRVLPRAGNRLVHEGATEQVAAREEHATGPITADEVIEVHRLLSGDAPLGELLYGHAS